MDYQYSEQASSVVEYFFMPLFISFGDKEDAMEFTAKEKENFKDYFEVIEDIKLKLAPFKEEARHYYLFGYSISLLHAVYYDAEENGVHCETVKDVHDYALSLSKEKIRKCIAYLLINHKKDNQKDFWTLLEESTIKAETKWYFSQFYRNPQESMKQLVDLSIQLNKIYRPYFEKGLTIRQSYAKQFSLEKFIQKLPANIGENLLSEEFERHIYILSPWLIRLSMIDFSIKDKFRLGLIITCHIENFFHSEDDLDDEDFSIVLKLLSDTSRYQVLLEVLKPNFKSKDIAKQLNITAAAVSFHTQKLVNAQILQFNTEDEDGKYNLNKKLLNNVLEKMVEDFKLNEK
ncbi:ArsR/SmtB family transcription factor [Streptococcus parauberis]|uniref:ArsR/SmtB family transcription factor n=1 Tax=Streptococcus parauberis TaxID=1348 RepID=UPI000CCDE04D|nr:transcriptional regulator [Streptococcus parauberis]PNY19904.1 hypothetical protein ASN86_00567 [Streptococcus parauberis]